MEGHLVIVRRSKKRAILCEKVAFGNHFGEKVV
jgi:hypothetical protein